MKRIAAVIGCVAMCTGMIAMVGCQKKVTKIEQPEPRQEVKRDAPPPEPPTERESFETVDADAAIKNVLQTVYFDYDKSDLKQETLDRLQLIGKLMSETSSLNVLCEGHADERGTNEYNIGLGEHRAKAIKEWLVNYGIADRRLEITSYGRERPAFPNCAGDEPCHARNRRVEFKVLAK